MKMIKKMLFAFVAIATMTFVGCSEKEEIEPENPQTGNTQTLTSLAGTSWVAIYDDTYQGYPAELTYSVDFAETDGSIMLELSIAGQVQNPDEYAFSYTFSDNVALCTIEGVGSFTMEYHPESNTMTANIEIGVENGGSLGGEITLYPRGTDPIPHSGGNGGGVDPGDIDDSFPANTNWTASEDATYQGAAVQILYSLSFSNDHTGTLDFSIVISGSANPAQGFQFNWSYDESAATGAFVIQNQNIPFTYDATDETIHASFPFGFSETELFGENVVFTRVQKKVMLKYAL